MPPQASAPRAMKRCCFMIGFGLQASGRQTRSPEDHAQLVARYGELIRGLQRLLDAFRPEAEARSLKPEAPTPKPEV